MPFLRLLCLLAVCLLLGGRGPVDAASPAEEQELERVLDRYLEAMGGRSRLNAIHSLVIEGRMILHGGQSARLRVLKKRPNMVRTVVEIPPDIRIVNGYDGTEAWKQTVSSEFNVVETLDVGPYHAFIRDAAIESPLVAEGARRDRIRYLGEVMIENGLQCHHLRIDYPNGSFSEHFLDTERYLERKIIKHEWVDGEERINTVFPSVFRHVQGVVFAFDVTIRDDLGQETEMLIERIRINAGVLDTLFRRPSAEDDSAPSAAEGRIGDGE